MQNSNQLKRGADFLGKGMKFPPQLSDDGTHVFASSESEELIRESVSIILSTSPGERLMRPDFGCGIHRMAFGTNSPTTHSRVAYEVEEALKKWEPRIELEEVDVNADPEEGHKLNISIQYRVVSNNNRYNLVFPFYLERE